MLNCRNHCVCFADSALMTCFSSDVTRLAMLEEVCNMVREGKLKAPPCTKHSFENFKTAISDAMKSYSKTKQLLILNDD